MWCIRRARQARAVLDGTPRGRALARRLGVRYLIVDRGTLAGAGAHSYSAGDATGGSGEAARFKDREPAER